MTAPGLINVFLLAMLVVAAIGDIRHQRIPNWLTFTAAGAGIAFHIWMSGVAGLWFSLLGLLLGLALLIGFYLSAGMGAGDVKLMGAVGALVGPKCVFWAFIYTAILGGVFALVLLVTNPTCRRSARRYWEMIKTLFRTGELAYIPPAANEKMPVLYYGAVIAVGTSLSMVKDVI